MHFLLVLMLYCLLNLIVCSSSRGSGSITVFIHFHGLAFTFSMFTQNEKRMERSQDQREGQVWVNRPNRLTRLLSKSAPGVHLSGVVGALVSPSSLLWPQDFSTLHSPVHQDKHTQKKFFLFLCSMSTHFNLLPPHWWFSKNDLIEWNYNVFFFISKSGSEQ